MLDQARTRLAEYGGRVTFVRADLRDTATITAAAAAALDFTQPAAVLLLAVLHFIPDTDDPAAIVAGLASGLAPGSFVVISHLTADIAPTQVSAGVAAETDIVTVQSVLRQAAVALDLYVTEQRRPAAKAAFAADLHRLTTQAAPGSDHQLAFVRSFAAVAGQDDQLDLLQGLLDATVAIDGLTVDTELRWAILRRLVSCGRLGEPAIDAELDRDNTASGRRHCATVRAGRPTPQAKAEAWASVVESEDLPNALQTATIAGFLDPDHRELLRPYVERYFEVVGPVWENRSHEMSSNIAVGLYPGLFVEEATVARTDTYLAQEHPVAPLARLLSEGRDGVQRAMRCQARDALA